MPGRRTFAYEPEPTRRRGPWRSLEAGNRATLERVDWLNARRLPAPIGNVPPEEAGPREKPAQTDRHQKDAK